MKSQQDKTFVIAGDYRQFELWLRETRTPREDVVYVSRPNIVRGLALRPEQIVRYGTWYEREDLGEIGLAIDAACRSRK